jgi:hypothetical protein
MAGTVYRQFRFLRIVFYTLALLVFLSAGTHAASGAEGYTVEKVEVDVTAKNAVKAREKALDEAQVKAYEILAERFLSPEEFKNFKAPDAMTVSTLVQDFEVTNEQLSSTRYKGIFTIRFRPNAVKSYMGAQGRSSFTGEIPKPVLVLPFYQEGTRTMLWTETNPWMNAWRNLPSDKSMMQPTVLPLGDAQDMAQVGDLDGLDYDPVRVQELAARYNADEVAIALLTIESTAAQPRATINLYTNGFEGPRFVQKMSVDAQAGETPDALYTRAAQKLKAALRQNWKANAAYVPPSAQSSPTTPQTAPQSPPPVAYTRPALGPSQSFVASARFASAQDWVRLKNTLDRLYGMQAVMVRGLKPREAILDLRYAGNAATLQAALQTAGIMMRAMPGGTLELYMTPAQPVYRN